ncbi:MAG: hypothetical protein E6K18_08015 [Methanobacteriota archaeon]|nr:MAG: hypothetical protein E6K18_08015 [Euryarchaeota archaeon]
MKVLIYENRKQDPIIFDVSTKEKYHDALRALFAHLDVDWMAYDSLKGPLPLPESTTYTGYCPSAEAGIEVVMKKPKRVPLEYESPCPFACGKSHKLEVKLDAWVVEERREHEAQAPLYKDAAKGDIDAIETLLYERAGNEYEGFSVQETTGAINMLAEIEKRRKGRK